MKCKRAIGIGVVSYIVIFIVGMITATLMGIDLSSAAEVSNTVWLVNIVLSIVLIAVFSIWYFKDKSIKPSAKEGALLGLVFIGIGFVIDALIIIPYIIISDAAADTIAYYANPFFWVAMLSVIATASVVGYLKEKNSK